MNPSSAAATAYPSMSERALQDAIIDPKRGVATLLGWTAYHTHDSRHSAPGFPDLVLVRPPRIVFAELKTATGKLSEAQVHWIALLGACGAEVYLWRPDDLHGQILEVLR